jgi:hypothetical protein
MPLPPAQLPCDLAATLARVVDALVLLVGDLSLAVGADLATLCHQFIIDTVVEQIEMLPWPGGGSPT